MSSFTQRDEQQGADPGDLDPGAPHLIIRRWHQRAPIGDVDQLFSSQQPVADTVSWPKRLAEHFPEALGQSVRCGRAKILPVIDGQMSVVGAAERMRLFQDRIEHRREIAGRRIDDLQHLGSRRLLLQGLTRLGNEARVLDRDDRLRGEILEEVDLLVGKGPHLLAVNADRPQQSPILAH